MKFQHFFWDFDGTLFDTYARITRAIQKALKDLGVEATYEEIFSKAKISIGKCLAHFTAPLGIEKDACMAAYHAHAEEEPFDTILLYPGAREMLEEICRRGGKNYVYTHSGLWVYSLMERMGIRDCFDFVLDCTYDFPRKPAPDALNFLIEKCGIDKSRALMIGDRDLDIEVAHNAGIAACLFDSENFYPNLQAEYRITSLDELKEII